jgi:hypothetical protein
MKKVLLFFAVLFLFSFQTQQSDPVLTVRLTVSEWQQVVYMIDNAAIAGEIRKPILVKIQVQADQQLKALSDTTKPKKKD